MPLTNIGLQAQVSWALQGSTTTGFSAAKESDASSWILTNLNLTTFNEVYAAKLTIAASGNTTIDLTSLTNLVGESFAFGHVLGIYVYPSIAAGVTVGPGASNGLPWMLGGTTPTVTVNAGGIFVWSDPSGPGTVVDSTHKTLKITNLSGSVSAVVTVAIFGSTT